MDEKKTNVLGWAHDPRELEFARTFGQPVDPEKRIPELVDLLCEVDYAEPSEHDYYFDAIAETKEVITMDSGGRIVQLSVSADTETALTFYDLMTREYYVKLHNLVASSEKGVLARKKKTISRALNREEVYRVLSVIAAGATSASNTHGKESGASKTTMGAIFSMEQDVKDYGDNLVLIAGTTVDNDISRMEYDENKYHSVMDAFKALNITKKRVPFSVSRATQSGASASLSATEVLTSTTALMVATSTEMGKPVIFVRRRLNADAMLGGAITTEDEPNPERLVFVSLNPTVVPGTAKYLGVGLTGYEQVAIACTNIYGCSSFDRTA